jgi:antitoxin (DNA-binding transcriptional repressor) of toxin-antitoxin stability system
MHTFNIHEAKTHLSRLIERAVAGEAFIVAKAGVPLVKVSALEADSSKTPPRLGFLAGQIAVPDDFDQMGTEAIVEGITLLTSGRTLGQYPGPTRCV